MAAGGTYRGRHGGRSTHHGRGRGRGGVGHRPQTASAHGARHQSNITCYKCGEKGHIATSCPTTSSSTSSTQPSTSTGNLTGQSSPASTTTYTSIGHGLQRLLISQHRTLRDAGITRHCWAV